VGGRPALIPAPRFYLAQESRSRARRASKVTAGPVAGGLAPLIAAWLVQSFPGQTWPLALYIILVSLLSLACAWSLAETSRKDLDMPG
jgi:hypothetical protein